MYFYLSKAMFLYEESGYKLTYIIYYKHDINYSLIRVITLIRGVISGLGMLKIDSIDFS